MSWKHTQQERDEQKKKYLSRFANKGMSAEKVEATYMAYVVDFEGSAEEEEDDFEDADFELYLQQSNSASSN